MIRIRSFFSGRDETRESTTTGSSTTNTLNDIEAITPNSSAKLKASPKKLTQKINQSNNGAASVPPVAVDMMEHNSSAATEPPPPAPAAALSTTVQQRSVKISFPKGLVEYPSETEITAAASRVGTVMDVSSVFVAVNFFLTSPLQSLIYPSLSILQY